MDSSPVPIAVAVIEHGDRILIGLRAEGTALAGYWEFPGGKVNEAETHEEAAVRETLEETGLAVEVVDEFSPATHDYEHASVAIRFFRCRLAGDDQLTEKRFRWVTRNELAEYQFPPANDPLIARLMVPEP